MSITAITGGFTFGEQLDFIIITRFLEVFVLGFKLYPFYETNAAEEDHSETNT
jgi:hypothetical protein